jgi:hypothetical protein
MKTQRTTRYVWCLALLMALLCGNLQAQQAGPSFFDDFSDGDLTDGLPVNWAPFDEGPSGHSGAMVANPDGTYYTYRDVSISAQIKRISDHSNGEWVSGLLCRWNEPGPTGGYWIEVRPPNRFWFGHRDRYILRSATLPFDVDETELIIRVDAVGDQLKAWCWPADEPMPREPQISFVDSVAPEGPMGFYYSNRGGEAIYRWVKVESLDVPSVDFNGDGTVDIDDLLRIIESWGQNDPAVDLVPDGVVDKKDLEALMDHWQQDVNDLTLLAHWALDETEGDIACDSGGLNDAALAGGPAWQPEGGILGGALLLDGIDDCIETPLKLDPSAGPFSVFAWVLGGAPGQVIVSQVGGADWLMVADEGVLATELSLSSVTNGVLVSAVSITDGNWHRVGLTWDGSTRSLYVDDVNVAEDPEAYLAGQDAAVYIGASGPGNRSRAATFFSGLIDDVRIYKRAVKP